MQPILLLVKLNILILCSKLIQIKMMRFEDTVSILRIRYDPPTSHWRIKTKFGKDLPFTSLRKDTCNTIWWHAEKTVVLGFRLRAAPPLRK
ncbi:unnamed protein product [Cylicostephanus goldi]|uniref:Uncharacterized protein n=1 Tax=Cylicostephanus goldi TaxID=71465 RepID=A0A3P6RAG2_CYLGO|nr:unnamed protein product [Cylicostephanus goldi]